MNKSDDNIDILNELQEYMFNKLENTYNFRILTKKSVSVRSQIKKYIPPDIYIPKHKDTLFWCFYIIKNGDIEYELLNNINIIIEKKIKIEYVEKIRKEKQLIKTYKFASITHIENQLANEERLDIKTFFSLCVFENLNILYIYKNTYYELLMNDSDKIYMITRFDNPLKYGYQVIIKEKAEISKTNLFQIFNIDKPLKAITSYTIKELIDFCNKLSIEINNIDTGKHKCKKDLYESLIKYF
jgi:ribosomal protein S17